MKILAHLIVLLWALCILIRSLVDQLGMRMRASAPARRRRPAGLEWRKIGRLPAGRIVALRVQVIVC